MADRMPQDDNSDTSSSPPAESTFEERSQPLAVSLWLEEKMDEGPWNHQMIARLILLSEGQS